MNDGADRIDSKYEVLSELGREGHLRRYSVHEAGRPAGERRRLEWFEVSTSAQRSSFHRYRSGLKALAPAALLDVVARPGAYYTVWKPLPGRPLAEFLALPVRGEAEVQGLRDLGTGLAEHGFALQDADVVFPGDGPGEAAGPQIAYLAPAERPLEEAVGLNAALLTPLGRGKLRRRRPALSIWAVLPGLLFLGEAGYLGAQAGRIYLNPPIQEIRDVTGKPAEDAARTLVASGFRVAYTDGEGPGLPVGAVLSQDPPGGSNLPVGRQVTLTVNNPPPLTVPKLDDLNLNQVAGILAENRLARGQVLTVDGSFSGTPKGRVIAQLPEAGATAQRGDKVTLLVSGGIGSKLTWLPPLTGLSFEDARDLARRAGLVVHTVQRKNSDARQNTVLDQQPAAYVKVDVGSPVTLTIATIPVSGPTQKTGALPLPPPYVPPPRPVPPVVAPPPVQTPVIPPVTPDPATQTPATQNPATQTPATQLPGTPAGTDPSPATTPVTPPVTPPATQTPATQTPATQTPPAQTPATQSPATQTPPVQTPPQNTPVAPDPTLPSSGQTLPSTPATQTPPAQTPATQTPATSGAAARTVALSYNFPSDLPSGTVDIIVRDADGTRTVLAATPSSTVTGATAQQDNVQVRGDAVFVVRVNGQEFTSFPAR